MGFNKHSFSLLGTLQIFLSGNSFAVTLCRGLYGLAHMDKQGNFMQ